MQDRHIHKRVEFTTPNQVKFLDEIHLVPEMTDFCAALEAFDSDTSNEDLGIPESVSKGPAFRSNFNPIPYTWENLIERVPDLASGYAYLLFLDGAPAMTYTFFDVVHVSIMEYQRQGKNVLAYQVLNNPTEDQTDAAGLTSSTEIYPRRFRSRKTSAAHPTQHASISSIAAHRHRK